MNRELTLAIYVFLLAIFVGLEVIGRVPAVLHTPLMSATNAIHGIVLLGAMIIAGQAETPGQAVVALIAVILGAANVFGGFAVTHRMLELFRDRRGRE